MAKVKFARSVKYNGAYYSAYTSFEVLLEDVPELVEAGAVLVGDSSDVSVEDAGIIEDPAVDEKPKKKRK